MKEKLVDFKDRVIKNKVYLLILIAFFLIAGIISDSFNSKNSLVEYIYNYSAPGAATSISIKKDVELSQKFIATGNNMSRIGIKVSAPQENVSSNVNIRVLESNTGKEILNQDVFLGSLEDGDFMEINLQNQFQSKNKEYEIIIKGTDGDEYNSIQFPYASNKSDYLKGSSENGNKLEGKDFVLKLTYNSPKIITAQILVWFILFIFSAIFMLYGAEEINEKTFLKLAVILGIFFIVCTPAFHEFDECNHYFRALMISEGDFIDDFNEDGEFGGVIPVNFDKFLLGYKEDGGIRLKNIFTNTASFFETYSDTKEFVKNVYFSSTLPIGHIIPAVGIFITRLFGMSVYSTIISGRLMVYILYCFFGYLTLKNLKYYKSVFFAVITVPISFWLAGTIHLDPTLNISCLLFASICLKYMMDKDENSYITKFDLIMLVISAVLIITCKYLVSIPILVMFFFIPKKKFKSLKGYIAFIIFAIVLGVSLIGWQFWMLDRYPYIEDRNGHVDQQEQIEYIKDNLGKTATMFIRTLQRELCVWLHNFSYEGVISSVASSTGLILVVSAILEKNKNEDLKKNKVFNIIAFLIFFIVIALGELALYLSFTPVGKSNVEGYQSRYVISPIILCLIPLANIFNIKNDIKDYDKKLIFVILLANINLILSGIMRSFISYKM